MIAITRISIQRFSLDCLKQAMIFAMLLPTIALVAVPTASAQMTEVNGCMQDIAGFALGCTANDIQISGVARDASLCPGFWDPLKEVCLLILDDGCAFPGDDVTFTAVFEVLSTAKRRHDIGIYFVTDGDPNGDGAISGACSISTLPFAPDPPWIDLDGTSDDPGGVVQDTCGDIQKPDRNPLFPEITLTAKCVDADGDGNLNLPNCTSWRQFGANELCTSPLQAFPGSPSKCRCDDGFNVPIDIPPAELAVTKTPVSQPCDPVIADTACVDEPGDEVTFRVTVENIGIDPANSVTLDMLTDSPYGDITQIGNGITATNCSVPQTICPSVPDTVCDTAAGELIGTYTCEFTVQVDGNADDSVLDTVFASGLDDNGNTIGGEDTANVNVLDVLPDISVTKTANPTFVKEPGGDVEFTVTVTNLSTAEAVTIVSLSDDPFGIVDCLLADGTTNIVGQVLQPNGESGDSLTCTFTEFVAGNFGEDAKVDTVTAAAVDDEFVDDTTTPSNKTSDMDTASVSITNDVAMIELLKSANPDNVDETAGGLVTFTLVVNNLSVVDPLTITSLTDQRPLGATDVDIGDDCLDVDNLSLIGETIAAGGSLTCTFTVNVSGDASPEPNGETDLATVVATDNDLPPNTVSDDDDATVTFNDVPPAASLTKTPTMATVTYQVVVTNDSDAESLTIDALIDDKFGDITKVAGPVSRTTCATGIVLSPSGQASDTFTCEFDAKVTTQSHTNILTGTVSDNEGGEVMPSDSATVTLQSNP